jgi:hypothetical protein
MPKQSSLAGKNRTNRSGPDHLKTGHKKCPKNGHSNNGRFGIQWPTVLCLKSLAFNVQYILVWIPDGKVFVPQYYVHINSANFWFGFSKVAKTQTTLVSLVYICI